MIFLTSPGKTYSVNSVSGCTVSVGGTTLTTIPANVQTTFIAPEEEVLLSDDNAIIVEVTGIGADVGGAGGSGGSGGEPEGDYVTMDANGAITGGRLDNLTNGRYMCYNSSLTSWDIDLPALTDSYYMFYGCKSLTSFTVDLPALTNGSNMFSNCSSLTSFTGDLSALTSVNSMFRSCTSLTSWNVDLPALTNGNGMFGSCTSLTSWNVDLPALTDGNGMFGSCTSLTSWNVDLPALTNGSNMFSGCTSLTSFTGDLSALTIGNYMFSNCSSLTNLDIDLPALTSVSNMFQNCTSLASWNIDLPALKSGYYMFSGCTSLTSFTGDLSALTNGSDMFYNCSSLTSFTGDLSALTSVPNMFDGCILNKESALHVLNSIPTYTSGSHYLTIGIHVDYKTDGEVAAAITKAKSKKWNLTVQWNGTATAATFALRPAPKPPVYAKYEQHEHGAYVDSNNVRYMIDWGHEIHSPDDETPEELGYTLFDSLEAALTEWGLTEYVEPELLIETENL